MCQKGEDEVLGSVRVPEKDATIFIAVCGLKACLGIACGKDELWIAKEVDIRALSTEVAGGFVGCTVGMYAVDECTESKPETDVNILDAICFRNFSYESL